MASQNLDNTSPRVRLAGRYELSPRELAEVCIAEADGNLDRACALAGRRARGAKLRAVHVAIGDAFLRAARVRAMPSRFGG